MKLTRCLKQPHHLGLINHFSLGGLAVDAIHRAEQLSQPEVES